MQNDPLVEWQKLCATYGAMYDEELLQLAADAGDLTEHARQALGEEMRKRGLDLERSKSAPPVRGDGDAIGAYAGEGGEGGEPLREFTWKTALCGCESQEEAWQIYEVLRRAGIESWIVRPGGRQVWDERMVGNIQVQVAADQLDEARAVIANPIPQEIVELCSFQAPEYEPPVCPKCGAGDPILEGVDPVNSWRCEACDQEWTEGAEEARESAEK